MAELIECCATHQRAYKKLIHDYTQNRIERTVYDSLWQVLRNAAAECATHPVIDPDADIAAFAL